MSGVNAYSQRPSARDTEALVMRHAELVKRIAYHLAGRLPASVEVDDLIQAGMLGLLEAASNYSAGRGASFETYAGIRIRGAMIDELRAEVAKEISPIAKPREIHVVPELPKTRSGKIMRRLLRDVAEGRELGDTSTLVDPSVFEAIRASK